MRLFEDYGLVSLHLVVYGILVAMVGYLKMARRSRQYAGNARFFSSLPNTKLKYNFLNQVDGTFFLNN